MNPSPAPQRATPPPRRRGVNLEAPEVATHRWLGNPGQSAPLFHADIEGVDLAHWLESKRGGIEELLLRHGGVLFRGFHLNTEEDFARAVGALGIEKMEYLESATPRTPLKNGVYTSTEFPAEYTISQHNELSYVSSWPMKLCFFCEIPAEEGGETPIADMRKVLHRLDPKIQKRFEEKGWRLVRNFRESLGLTWNESFHTADKEEVERYCHASEIEFEWLGQDHLRTRHTRPAIRRHPKSGEAVWFNHVAFWHESSLPEQVRQRFRAEFKGEDFPFNTFYGDGGIIEDEVVEELRQAINAETHAFPWKAGDFLLLDNMIMSHGRRPYRGARRILVSMGEASGRATSPNS